MTTFSEYLENGQMEWLVTNGLGGFACGTVSGIPSRRYHSYLDAALTEPFGRTIMLNHVIESLILEDGREVHLAAFDKKDTLVPQIPIKNFKLDLGIPIWQYEFEDIIIQKKLFLIYRQNTLHMTYELLSGNKNIKFVWRPFFHFRANENQLHTEIDQEYKVRAEDSYYEIECAPFPILRMYNSMNAPFTHKSEIIDDAYYAIEDARGYNSIDTLNSPGYFSNGIDTCITFVVSTEPWSTIKAISPREAFLIEKIRKKNLLKNAGFLRKTPISAKLTLAADQFIFTPVGRHLDMVRLSAIGEEVKSIIAGFPWFTDWGRDVMISLEGLTLTTGRSREAFSILHTFSYYVRDGLIPNMFPDGRTEGIYNTVDATLWFFHAIDRYIAYTKHDEILEFLIPVLKRIIDAHIKGTRFGIGMTSDGLLIQGEEGVQLTWMDAKVADWVVTPRRGKAVEINALWYNALCLFEEWHGGNKELIEKCKQSFNEKFWYERGSYLYDVIDGENGSDTALRPNQLFAISLRHPVLNADRWECVLKSVEENLLTPYGLRTLAPHHPDYKSTYDGDLRARDAAYHQGTVWPWLIGPYIDVLLKVYPDSTEKAKKILSGLEKHMEDNCIDTISEIFDADQPFNARGCFAQAWSVAEFLRCFHNIYNEKK